MLPQVVQTRLKIRAVTSTDADAATQNPKISLRGVQRDRDPVPPKQEGVSSRRPPDDRQSRVGVEVQRRREPRPNRHPSGLEEFRVPHEEHVGVEVHVIDGERERLAEAKPGAVQEQDQCPKRQRGNRGRLPVLRMRKVQRRRRVQHAPQFFLRVDVGRCVRRPLREAVRHRRGGHETALHGEAEKPGQGVVLQVPTGGDRPRPLQERPHGVLGYVVDLNSAGHTRKRSEDHRAAPEAQPRRALHGHVLFDDLSECHASPPRSKAATSRRPWRSTLAYTRVLVRLR
jgi:hypothetical protein